MGSLGQSIGKMLATDQVVTITEKLVAACLNEGFNDIGKFCDTHKLEELKSIASVDQR